MNSIPISTDYSQSKRLIEAGLPVKTADRVNAVGPSWSLSKLISLMPNDIGYLSDDVDPTNEEAFYSALQIQYNLKMNNNSVRYETYDGELEKFRAYGFTLLDAVIDAVEWLLNEGWIDKETNPTEK